LQIVVIEQIGGNGPTFMNKTIEELKIGTLDNIATVSNGALHYGRPGTSNTCKACCINASWSK